MLFANGCEGFISSCYGGNTVNGVFWAFWFLLGVFRTWRVLVFLGFLSCTRLGLLRCASCWTFLGIYVGFMMWEPYMLALAGRPSLHGYDACMVYWTKGALRRICRQKQW